MDILSWHLLLCLEWTLNGFHLNKPCKATILLWWSRMRSCVPVCFCRVLRGLADRRQYLINVRIQWKEEQHFYQTECLFNLMQFPVYSWKYCRSEKFSNSIFDHQKKNRLYLCCYELKWDERYLKYAKTGNRFCGECMKDEMYNSNFSLCYNYMPEFIKIICFICYHIVYVINKLHRKFHRINLIKISLKYIKY